VHVPRLLERQSSSNCHIQDRTCRQSPGGAARCGLAALHDRGPAMATGEEALKRAKLLCGRIPDVPSAWCRPQPASRGPCRADASPPDESRTLHVKYGRTGAGDASLKFTELEGAPKKHQAQQCAAESWVAWSRLIGETPFVMLSSFRIENAWKWSVAEELLWYSVPLAQAPCG